MKFEDIKYQFQEKWQNFLENPVFDRMKSWYEALPKREQRLLRMVLIGVIVLVFINIVYSFTTGISDKENDIDDSIAIARKLDDLNEFMVTNDAELQKKKIELSGGKYISLIDLLDKQQTAAFIKSDSRVGEVKESLKKEVEGGKYYESVADVKYSKITIRQLTKLLFGIEKSESMVKIASIKINRRTDDVRYIDAEFQIVARSPK
ncbi:MAG: hypothetical protein V1647_02000 [Pseudomonadota bacterium]